MKGYFLDINGEEMIYLISRICFGRPSLKSDPILNSAKKKMMDFYLISACRAMEYIMEIEIT